eukprot:6948-Heterococcus_DN1.PRE.1
MSTACGTMRKVQPTSSSTAATAVAVVPASSSNLGLSSAQAIGVAMLPSIRELLSWQSFEGTSKFLLLKQHAFVYLTPPRSIVKVRVRLCWYLVFEHECTGPYDRALRLKDIRSNVTILTDLLKGFIQKASNIDGISKEAYDYWLHSVTDMLTAHRQPQHNQRTFRSDGYEKLMTSAAIKQLQDFSKHFVITITDEAAGNFAFICKEYYELRVNATLTSDIYTTVAITQQKLSDMITKASEEHGTQVDKLYDRHTHTYSRTTEQLPTFFLTLKAHKNPPGTRPI